MLFPQTSVFLGLRKYLLMVILFFAFLGLDFKLQAFPKSKFWILIANVTIASISYAVLASFNLNLWLLL